MKFLIPFTISLNNHSLPCLIKVTHYERVPPWRGNLMSCPSDLDFRGYEEMEWEILKPSGFYSPWLAGQATDSAAIECAISEAMREERNRI